MKGDFTRDTFRARRHYWGVLRQQGRVDLDADWNEQVQISRHHRRVRTLDLVGEAGGPALDAGFELRVEEGALTIGAGRYYVAGILCENEAAVGFGEQPDGNPDEPPPGEAGLHLAYLDLWDRHVTAHGDPPIREVALGGPDTATRGGTAWQVRTRPLAGASPALSSALAALAAARADEDDEAIEVALQSIRILSWAAVCADPLALEGGSLEPGTGTMAARASAGAGTPSDPCRFEPGGGYRRLENRLYRVEIHEGGTLSEATFKFSRDNGSLAFAVEEFLDPPGTTTRVVVRRLGFDTARSLRLDDWVEITSDADERAGRAGTLARIVVDPDPADRILVLSVPVDVVDPGLHPVVRRWDGAELDTRNVWQELEDGVEVRFVSGTFHPGDYWTIPARTNTADVEWPPHPSYPGETISGAPTQLPPFGVERHRAALAVLAHDGSDLVAAIDQRRLFPAATEGAALFQLGGDGQSPRLPGGELPWPIEVGVADGERPLPGVMVRFEVHEGGGSLAAGFASGTVLSVPTDAEGVASVAWTTDVAQADHRVEARLLDRCEDPTHLPVYFNASVNYALRHLSGDGQEGLPGEAVSPLRVCVSDGRWPVEAATVEFTVVDGAGTLGAAEVSTGPDGVAQVEWTLGPADHRQSVRARLLDGPGGSPVHDASVGFNANLSLAAEVAYTPAGDCTLSSVATVQDALDALCRREAGGTCRVVVTSGGDLAAAFEAIADAGSFEGAICLAEGDYVLEKEALLEGAGDVLMRGVGPATRIQVKTGGSALRFVGCGRVSVRDLSVRALEPAKDAGVSGILHFEDCAAVTVEEVRIACPPATLPRMAGIAVMVSQPSKGSEGPVRIEGCEIEAGFHQIGIFLSNLRRAVVEGNVVRSGAMGDLDLEERLRERKFAEHVADNLISFDTEVENSPRTEELGWRRVAVGSESAGFEMSTRISTPETWAGVLEKLGVADMTPARGRKATRRYLVKTLLNAGAADETPAFRRWVTAAAANLTSAPFAGVVVGGKVAGDVVIASNAVQGALHGIVVGTTLEGLKTRTGSLAIAGNTLEIAGASPIFFEGAGITVGSCESLVVSDNAVATTPLKQDNPRAVVGVRVSGKLGPRMIVRGGLYQGTTAGVRIEPGADSTWPQRLRWVVKDNVATSGPMLEAPCVVVEDGNVPPRPKPCPGDQPA